MTRPTPRSPDDMYAAARNALVMNATTVSRTVMDQARGFGEGRSAELEQGRRRIWATGIGFWGDAEGESHGLDVDFRAGLLGGEVVAHETTKLGAFFGYGSTDYKGRFRKIDGDDLHFGVYGLTDGSGLVCHGVAYRPKTANRATCSARPRIRTTNATVLQAYARSGLPLRRGGREDRSVLWGSLGRVLKSTASRSDERRILRREGPEGRHPDRHARRPRDATHDVGHDAGGLEGRPRLVALLRRHGSRHPHAVGCGRCDRRTSGEGTQDQVNLGLGITGQVSQNATVGVSYTGSFGTDVDTHGLTATFRYAF